MAPGTPVLTSTPGSQNLTDIEKRWSPFRANISVRIPPVTSGLRWNPKRRLYADRVVYVQFTPIDEDSCVPIGCIGPERACNVQARHSKTNARSAFKAPSARHFVIPITAVAELNAVPGFEVLHDIFRQTSVIDDYVARALGGRFLSCLAGRC